MGSKFQRYALIIIIALVLISIGAKFMYNKRMNSYKWDEDDREILIQGCIDDLGGRAVRFPGLSKDYCSCMTDSIMAHFKKAEYLQLRTEPTKDQQRAFMPFTSNCFNTYQQGMYDATELGDDF